MKKSGILFLESTCCLVVFSVLFFSNLLGMDLDKYPNGVCEDQGVRWISYVPLSIEKYFLEMAQEEREARRHFTDNSQNETRQNIRGKEKEEYATGVNLVSMTVLFYGENDKEPLYSTCLSQPKLSERGKRIFFVSNEHSFTQFEDYHQKNPRSVIIGLEKKDTVQVLDDCKNLLEEYGAELAQKFGALYRKFKDPDSPTSEGRDVKDIFDSLKNDLGDMVSDQKARERDGKIQELKEEIQRGVGKRLCPEYDVEIQNVSKGILEKAFNQKSHQLDAEQYLLYRLNASVEDEKDQYIKLESVFSEFTTHEKIQRIIVLFHSTYDMCFKCSVSMARDYASLLGSMATLRDLVEEYNQAFNYVYQLTGNISPELNIIVASSTEYEEHGNSLRRYMNYRTEDDCLNEEIFNEKLKSFWERRLIMQWRIPTYKLEAMKLQKKEVNEDPVGFTLFD